MAAAHRTVFNLVKTKSITKTKGSPVKPVIRFQSKLPIRRSFKPKRVIRIRFAPAVSFVFRPAGFGLKPEIKTVQQGVD